MTLTVSVRRTDAALPDTPLLAVPIASGAGLPAALESLDDAIGGGMARALKGRDFRGGKDEVYHVSGGTKGVRRVMLVGLGGATNRADAVRRAASVAARQAKKLGTGKIAWFAGDATDPELEAAVVGLNGGSWEYADLKTQPPEADRRAPLESAVILVDDPKKAKKAIDAGHALAEGYALAKRLGMMPGNLCTPDFLADTAKDLGKRHGLKVSVFGRKEMERMKMGSFLCVAQGTPQDPKLIALEYSKGKGAPIVLVGKGLCFDTGGISIKPAQSMEWMKFDMCGAAGVLGAMEAIARLGLAVNVVGLIGATTNMPSGTAVKPGDVVIASNGKSIEIINTDAEGRLVLADVLTYAKRYDPAVVVDAATLTGACVIALGHTATGVMGTDAQAVEDVIAASRRAGEPGWELPLWDEYKELIASDIADVKNSGGRPAGTITAALFLKEFAEGYPWVHLDIAGTAYSEGDLGYIPKGPTGVPVGTFVELVRGRVQG